MQIVEVVAEDGDELQWGAGADRMGECGDAVEQASGRAGEHEHEQTSCGERSVLTRLVQS